jgi:hypothetical protein
MRGAIPPLPQCAFMAWCSVKAQGQLHLPCVASPVFMLRLYAYDICGSVTSGARNLVLQALQFHKLSVCCESQAGQTEVIIELIKVLWRVRLG